MSDASRAESSSFSRAAQVVRDRWWVVALVTVACFVGALAVSLSSPEEYTATAKLLFRDTGFSSVLGGSNVFTQQSVDPSRTGETNVLLTTSTDVAQAVKASLKLPMSVDDLERNVKASAENNADLVDLTFTDSDPARAARVATAFAREYVSLRTQRDRRKVGDAIADVGKELATLRPDQTAERGQLVALLPKLVALRSLQFGNAEVADTASLPTSSSSPKPKRDGAVALLLGLALGLGLAFALDFFDRRVKTVEDFERLYGLRAIAVVPQAAFAPADDAAQHASFESFRMVRNGLAALSLAHPVRTLAVVSAVPAEGKTSVAVNLARTVAMTGERVVLVESDLRRPSFENHVRVGRASEGLTNALVGRRPARDLLVEDVPGMANLRVLPSGPVSPNAAELLGMERMGEILRELSAHADLVIIDAPPLLPVADSVALLEHPSVDAALIIARVYTTKREEVRRTRAIIEQHRLSTFGLVVTGVETVTGGYGGYGGYAALDGTGNGARGGRRWRAPRRSTGELEEPELGSLERA